MGQVFANAGHLAIDRGLGWGKVELMMGLMAGQ